MTISKDKKRYTVTLTPAHVDRFQGLCKRLGLPSSTMSSAIDDLIGNISDTFQHALDSRKMDVSDLFQLMANQIKILEEGEKKQVIEICSKCGKPMHKFHDCVLNPTPTVQKERKNAVSRQKRDSVPKQ